MPSPLKYATIAALAYLSVTHDNTLLSLTEQLGVTLAHLPPLFRPHAPLPTPVEQVPVTLEQLLQPHHFHPNDFTSTPTIRHTTHDELNPIYEAASSIGHFVSTQIKLYDAFSWLKRKTAMAGPGTFSWLKQKMHSPDSNQLSTNETRINNTNRVSNWEPVIYESRFRKVDLSFIKRTEEKATTITPNTTALVTPPKCALLGNETYQPDEQPQPSKWKWCEWCSEMTTNFRTKYAAMKPAREMYWFNAVWCYSIWTVFYFPFAIPYYFLGSLPWLAMFKVVGFAIYLFGLYRIWLLAEADRHRDRMMWEHEVWMERYRELTQGNHLFDEFAKLLPPKVEFDFGGKYPPNEWERNSHPRPNIHCVLRPEAIEEFMVKRELMREAGVSTEVSVAFHGTRPTLVQSCLDHGLLIPGQLIPGTMKTVAHTTDTGYYGCGCYLSPNRSYAEGYRASTGGVFICLVLRGRVKQVQYELGRKLEPGYDSHVDPSGSEWIIFNSRQILPVYMIHSSQEGPKTFKLPAWAKAIESLEQEATHMSPVTHKTIQTKVKGALATNGSTVNKGNELKKSTLWSKITNFQVKSKTTKMC